MGREGMGGMLLESNFVRNAQIYTPDVKLFTAIVQTGSNLISYWMFAHKGNADFRRNLAEIAVLRFLL